MDIRDLRIGNWIIYSETNEYVEVIEVMQSGLTVKFKSETTWIEIDYFEPIPLTEEILLKCGFVKNLNIDYRFHHTKIDITIDMDDYGLQISDTWEFGSIRYIHELQNLYYALTKTEIIINL